MTPEEVLEIVESLRDRMDLALERLGDRVANLENELDRLRNDYYYETSDLKRQCDSLNREIDNVSDSLNREIDNVSDSLNREIDNVRSSLPRGY